MQREFFTAQVTDTSLEGFEMRLRLKLCRRGKSIGNRWISIHIGDMFRNGLMRAANLWFPEDTDEFLGKMLWLAFSEDDLNNIRFKKIAPWELDHFKVVAA